MTERKKSRFNLLFFLISSFFCSGLFPVEASLKEEDCKICHDLEYQKIIQKGADHRDKLTCFDCHPGHPPKIRNNIPDCTDCHDSSPHRKMADCSSCHPKKNNCSACHDVHQPLAFTDKAIALRHCQVCHPQVYQKWKNTQSKHGKLKCSYCHLEHRMVQTCSDCHGKPHAEGTHNLFPECATCHHGAHSLNMPK